MGVHISISPNGRLSLPVAMRKRMGVHKGGDLVAEETEDGVILRTAAQAVARAQAIFRKHAAGRADISVDDFLAQRRADSGE